MDTARPKDCGFVDCCRLANAHLPRRPNGGPNTHAKAKLDHMDKSPAIRYSKFPFYRVRLLSNYHLQSWALSNNWKNEDWQRFKHMSFNFRERVTSSHPECWKETQLRLFGLLVGVPLEDTFTLTSSLQIVDPQIGQSFGIHKGISPTTPCSKFHFCMGWIHNLGEVACSSLH